MYVNLGAYYLFGIPVAATLCFWLDLRGKGLWIGIQVGSFLQAALYSVITGCTNWEEKVNSKEKGKTFCDLKKDCIDVEYLNLEFPVCDFFFTNLCDFFS